MSVLTNHDVTINGIGFTANPKLAYANNYVRAARIISDRSQWHKIPTPEGGGKMTQEYVERFVYRSLVLGDLWFILYFVLGVPESIANTEFAVKMCKVVESGPTTLTLDVWSRGHLKTSTLSIAETIQYHLKYPERCTIFFSYKKGLAEKIAGSVKRAYETDFLKYLFPDVLYSNPLSESPSWSNTNGITVKRKCSTRGEPTIYASGLVEGMAQGFHCERLVFDDFETEDMAGSPDVLDDAFSKFQMAQYLHTKTENDTQRVIGTIYSHAGPIIRIKDMKKGDGTPAYHTRIVPGTVDGAFDGAPVLWTQAVLDMEKTKQHYAMQVLCDPTPKELRKFNSLDLLEIESDKIPKNLIRIMVIDPAGDSKTGKGDNWAIFVIGIEPKRDEFGGSDIYILNAIIDTMQHTEAIDTISRMYLGGGIIQKIGVEKVALSTTEIHIKAILEKRGRRISVEDDTLVILKPSGREKKARISSALSWPFSNGKIHVSKNVKSVYRDQLRSEMDKFPYWKDDGLDALAYAFDMIKDLDSSDFGTHYRYAATKYRGLGI